METSTLVLSVIFCVCSLFLTIPPGCTHLGNAQVTGSTAAPIDCIGVTGFLRKAGKNANGATRYNENSVNECQIKCANLASCTSLDFNHPNKECWIHTQNVENSLRDAGSNIDHYVKTSCPSTLPTSPAATTSGIPPTIPYCVKNKNHFDEIANVYVLGGTDRNRNTLIKCLEWCADTSSCTAVDFDKDAKKCYSHTTAANALTRQNANTNGVVSHWVKESCTTQTPTVDPTAPTTVPDNNAPVKFTALFTNNYDAAVDSDPDAFIETFTREFCDDTGVRCSRLLRPMDPDDVEEVTETTNPGPAVGSIRVLGELAPGRAGETNTKTIMDRFKDSQFQNFRHRLGPENGQIQLIPDTSTTYEGFSWERVDVVDPPEKPDDEGPLGLKTEYWVLIGLAVLALIITAVAIAVICLLRRNKNTKS